MSDITDINLNINITETENISRQLIFDRTQSDVDYALTCERNNLYTNENLKGAYNISDRNRAGAAVNHIIECLRKTGVPEACANIVKADWDVHDIIKVNGCAGFLKSLESLKRLLPYGQSAAVPENLDSLTYRKANDIERIIFDLCGVFLRLADAWLYAGDGFASDFDVWNWQGWD